MCDKCKARAEAFRREIDSLPEGTKPVELSCKMAMVLSAGLTLGYIISHKADGLTELDVKMLKTSRQVFKAFAKEEIGEMAKLINEVTISQLGPEDKVEFDKIVSLYEGINKSDLN